MAEPVIIFFGGKGGVGKSTCSSAYALNEAEKGKKVLLISTDPAHNLKDLFDVDIGNTIMFLQKNLYALELDAGEEAKRYIQGVKDNLAGLVHSHRVSEVHRQIDMASHSPGAEESALFDALVTIILEETAHFDLLVFDTAPTGHTLRLLSLPEMMEAWINSMLKRRKKVNENYSELLNDGDPVEDPIYQKLMTRKQKFAEAREWLLDKRKTDFVYVLTPEKLPIEETARAINELSQAKMKVSTLVINKCLPETQNEESFFQQRKTQETEYIKKIDITFPKTKKLFFPLLVTDVSTKADLKSLGSYFD